MSESVTKQQGVGTYIMSKLNRFVNFELHSIFLDNFNKINRCTPGKHKYVNGLNSLFS